MRRELALLVGLSLARCAIDVQPVTIAAPSPTAPVVAAQKPTTRFPARPHTRESETTTWASGEHETRTVETRLRFLRKDGEREIYEQTSVYGTAIVFYGDGIGNLQLTDQATHELALLDPPQIIVPASPTIGARWSTGHRLGVRVASTSRECEILANDHCQGITSHCTSHLTSGAIVDMHQYYCDGVGYSGEDDV